MTDEERLAEARKMCPDGYVVVPREASSIMAMRGAQARVGWYEPYADCACEYFKFDDKGESRLADALAPENRYHDDERQYWLAAAIWRGCIAGMEEWQARRTKEGATDFIKSWDGPFIPTRQALLSAIPQEQ